MRTLIQALLAALLACACRQLEPARDPPYYPESSKEPYAGRQWFAVGLAIVDRDSEDFEEVGDALGVTLDGGYEMTQDAWRPSLEFGTAWADHEVSGPSGTFDLDFWRLSFGLNLALRVEDQPLVPWVRGGLFYRWGNGTPEELADQDGRGYYLGLGFDVATQPGLGIGPAVTWYRGAEDDVEELYYGLVARFRF